jgi:hypothetical protein
MEAGLLQLHLVQVNRHIVDVKRHIDYQRKFIQDLAREGHETDVAEDLLKRLEDMLAEFEHHRRIVLEGLYMPL